MKLSGVGIDQMRQLADAMVAADRMIDTNGRPRCFGLVGTLGAGKTRLCQEIARACGVDPVEVTSPTFTLVKSYAPSSVLNDVPSDGVLGHHVSGSGKASQALRRTPGLLHHLDLYRVADEDELWELGLEELWDDPCSWTLIEWADRFVDCLPADMIWIHLDISDDEFQKRPDSEAPPRTVRFTVSTPEQSDWLARVRSGLAF